MRVFLADDHTILREGLRALLEREADVTVVGEAADGRDALTQVLALRPDVVVMDISMPGLNGVEATRRVVEALPRTKVIGLSMHADRRYVQAMFEAGAVGYLLKNAASDELLHALRVVVEGRRYVSPALTDVLVEVLRSAPPESALVSSALTAREREVLQLLSEGHTSKEIADRMAIALSTVETHRRQIMLKLDLHSIAELTRYAIRNGVTSID